MTHVVTARCMDCRYTDCVTVCPAECFYEVADPAMVVIDPEACVDCGLCVPECPINAIYPDSELPAHYAEWLEFAPELVAAGASIGEKKDALPSAVDLDAIHGREKSAGWEGVEPSGA
jgi:ferredoxin